jgi:hypothetical protein
MCNDSWNWQKNNPNGYEDNVCFNKWKENIRYNAHI